jgi:uncharacterized small protein (DUF1192 family)
MREALALAAILKETYKESGLDNVAFAKKLNDDPNLRVTFRAPLTAHHIASMISSLDLEPNKPRSKADAIGDALGVMARVAELEDQVKRLAGTVARLDAWVREQTR